MNINVFMQVLIESNLVKLGPDEKSILFENEKAKNKDTFFVLPNVLKKYYMV